MRTLQQGMSSESVKQWQGVLKSEGIDPGMVDGSFGPQVEAATKQFQTQHQLQPDGVVGPQTLAVAQPIAKAKGFNLWEQEFTTGPDFVEDLRQCRPYFLIPLQPPLANLTPIAPDASTARITDYTPVIKRINAWVGMMGETTKNPNTPVTDIFIASHGWHRNIYSALSAYDRLASRVIRLIRTGRMDDPKDTAVPPFPRNEQKFRPLFLTLHWHSDPGEDGFVDASGRRHKISFLDKATAVFEPRPGSGSDQGNLVADFEDIFALLSRLVAPDTDALSDEELQVESKRLIEKLDSYQLKCAPEARFTPIHLIERRNEKASVVWTCYHEAETHRVLSAQEEAPAAFVPSEQALTNTGRFLLGATGLTAVALLPFLYQGYTGLLDRIPVVKTFFLWKLAAGLGIPIALLLLACPWAKGHLNRAAMKRAKNPDKPEKGFPIGLLLAWLPLQIIYALPNLGRLLWTYFRGAQIAKRNQGGVPQLFDERYGERNATADALPPLLPRDRWFEKARKPIRWMQAGLAKNSRLLGLVSGLEAQFAFCEMQRKGVAAGKEAARFLQELYTAVPALENARIHFLGHSFGALVVANATRELAFQQRKVDSVSLLQGALGSNWFEGEETLRQHVRGAIACVYSRYDTANGFYYPGGNSGRYAAGFVGLTHAGNGATPETHSNFVLLVKPPNLNRAGSPPSPRILNLDASRLIFDGAVATGGGHDDIFKDDVVHLLWAVTQTASKATVSSSPPSNPSSAPLIAPVALPLAREEVLINPIHIDPSAPGEANTERDTSLSSPPTP